MVMKLSERVECLKVDATSASARIILDHLIVKHVPEARPRNAKGGLLGSSKLQEILERCPDDREATGEMVRCPYEESSRIHHVGSVHEAKGNIESALNLGKGNMTGKMLKFLYRIVEYLENDGEKILDGTYSQWRRQPGERAANIRRAYADAKKGRRAGRK